MRQLTDITLDQYIEELVQLRARNPGSGSWPVEKWMPSKGRHTAPLPTVAYRAASRVGWGPRGALLLPAFWQPGHDRPEDKGDAVIRV